MSWDYFALFCHCRFTFLGLGAFAAWRGKRPVVVYTLTCLGLAVFSASLSACGFLWSVLRCGRWGDRLWYSFFLPLAGIITFTVVGGTKWILGFQFRLVTWCLSASIF